MTTQDKVIDSNKKIIHRISGENTELRKRLKEIYERIRQNEQILAHFSEIENLVMECNHLDELVHRLLREMDDRFNVLTVLQISNSTSVNLDTFCPEVHHDRFAWLPDEILTRRLGGQNSPFLKNALTPEEVREFFPKDSETIRSMAVIPLYRRGKVLGCLTLGSEEPCRYQPDMSTHFLDQLGKKISLGLESIIMLEELRKSSVTDPLTGLYNRNYLTHVLEREKDRLARYTTPFSCILIDLDGFKQLNDTYGHQAGDRMLIHFAKILRHNLRKTDICIRYGGDEFVVVLPHCNMSQALATAHKLVREANEAALSLGEDVTVLPRASFGVSDCSSVQEEPDTVLAAADINLYEAKKRGGNTVFPQAVPSAPAPPADDLHLHLSAAGQEKSSEP